MNKFFNESKASLHIDNIEYGVERIGNKVKGTKITYNFDDEDCFIDVTEKNGNLWSFTIDFGSGYVYMLEPKEDRGSFNTDNEAFDVIISMLQGKRFNEKKSTRKSMKEERENNFKVSFPNNKEVFTFIKPMEYGLVTAQLMNNTSGNWSSIDKPYLEESGYMYINSKGNPSNHIEYDFAKVVSMDIDWGNRQIYFYTKGDVLMLHFYHLSDEEFEFLIYGDEHLDGIVSRFGK